MPRHVPPKPPETETETDDLSPPGPELSRPLDLEALRAEGGFAATIEADAAERDALARRFGTLAVGAFSAAVEAAPWGPGGVCVEGRAAARLTQTCVVTLEPVETALDEPFRRYFAPASRMAEAEALLVGDARDDLEPLPATLDLGEIAAEAAALAIDPYPRKPGAAFEGRRHGPPGAAALTDEAARPFAGLAALKARGDGPANGGGEGGEH